MKGRWGKMARKRFVGNKNPWLSLGPENLDLATRLFCNFENRMVPKVPRRKRRSAKHIRSFVGGRIPDVRYCFHWRNGLHKAMSDSSSRFMNPCYKTIARYMGSAIGLWPWETARMTADDVSRLIESRNSNKLTQQHRTGE